jgi:hypothetical protein
MKKKPPSPPIQKKVEVLNIVDDETEVVYFEDEMIITNPIRMEEEVSEEAIFLHD